MFQVYVPNISSVPDICCKCFYLNVTKLDLDVAYTCMLQAYVFKCFQAFHTYVCKCFIWILYGCVWFISYTSMASKTKPG
jgi:hypothetical protein